ncbi:HAD family hydrolase [Herbiconiux sp. 11R-BC]|uniref:HAD family hydrolase n=1 Tax=Herbiconiux sp. 11R-BC TaxID=3111637 RepID=UPI003C0CCB44
MSEHETGVGGVVREVPGAAEFVASFDPVDVALVTSALRGLARPCMAEAGIRLPKVVVAAEDVTAGKPHPEGYLRAAELLGHDPESSSSRIPTPASGRPPPRAPRSSWSEASRGARPRAWPGSRTTRAHD